MDSKSFFGSASRRKSFATAESKMKGKISEFSLARAATNMPEVDERAPLLPNNATQSEDDAAQSSFSAALDPNASAFNIPQNNLSSVPENEAVASTISVGDAPLRADRFVIVRFARFP